MRITKKVVNETFTKFLTAMNLREAKNHTDIGAYRLDHNAWGFRVERIVGKTGTVEDASERLSTNEMHVFLVNAIKFNSDLKYNENK